MHKVVSTPMKNAGNMLEKRKKIDQNTPDEKRDICDEQSSNRV